MPSSTRQLHQVPRQPMNPPSNAVAGLTQPHWWVPAGPGTSTHPGAVCETASVSIAAPRSAESKQLDQGQAACLRTELCSPVHITHHLTQPLNSALENSQVQQAGGVGLSPHPLPCIQARRICFLLHNCFRSHLAIKDALVTLCSHTLLWAGHSRGRTPQHCLFQHP